MYETWYYDETLHIPGLRFHNNNLYFIHFRQLDVTLAAAKPGGTHKWQYEARVYELIRLFMLQVISC